MKGIVHVRAVQLVACAPRIRHQGLMCSPWVHGPAVLLPSHSQAAAVRISRLPLPPPVYFLTLPLEIRQCSSQDCTDEKQKLVDQPVASVDISQAYLGILLMLFRWTPKLDLSTGCHLADEAEVTLIELQFFRTAECWRKRPSPQSKSFPFRIFYVNPRLMIKRSYIKSPKS